MKVAFDYDDVLIDFVGAWCDAYNAIASPEKHLTRDDLLLEGWDMAKHASKLVGEDWLGGFFRRNVYYWETAATTDGACETLKNLAEAGHEISIVTNKPEWAKHVVWKWLLIHRPPVSEVIITDHFGKHEVSHADVLVDDRPSTLDAWIASRPGRVGILFARSQNKAEQGKYLTAYTFDDVERIIGTLDRVEETTRV